MSIIVVVTGEEEQLEPLLRWGVAIAGGDGRLCVVWLEEAGGERAERAADLDPAEPGSDVPTRLRGMAKVFAELAGQTDLALRLIATCDDLNAVHQEVERADASLLVVEKAVVGRGGDGESLARRVFREAMCDTLLLRLAGGSDGAVRRILVPTSGGPNSRSLLRLGARMAREGDSLLVPLLVEPDAGEEATEVGIHILERTLRREGIEPDQGGIELKVVLGNHPARAIREEAETGRYDLVLVGASNVGKLRRSLFGTLPDSLLKGSEGVSIGVLRRARPMTHRLRHRFERWLHLRVPQLTREDRVTLFENIQLNAQWNFDFMALICLSTAIAALGLVLNSTAVVIGAMLVAPLMTPLLGGGLALVQGNLPLMKASAQAILYGFVAALLIGFAVGLVAPIRELTTELASRGGPTLLDMGVAFLSGVAASHCIARPRLSAGLAGVAIAAALVPPIATVGISLALGETANARGAAVLFATNVVAIMIGAAICFYAAGIRARREAPQSARGRWATRTFLGLLVASVFLAVPLASVLVSKVAPETQRSENRVKVPVAPALASSLRDRVRGNGPQWRVLSLEGYRGRAGDRVIEIEIAAPHPPGRELAVELDKLASGRVNGPVRVRLLTRLLVESD